MATQLLPNDTTELVPAGPLNTTPRQDYYTALRDYVTSLSSPYGTYIPEVSELLRYTAGSPTGRMGSGAYDPIASNPWAALTMDQNAPIDPSLLAAITSSVNPNAPYEQNVTYQFNPFSEGKYASSNPISVLYNTPIRLTDINGNTIMSGVGFQAAEQIAKAVQDAYSSGTKSEFRIDTGIPGDTTGDTFKTASIVSPEQNGFKLFATLAALATLGGGLLAPAGAGAGAGAGAAGAAGTAAGTAVGTAGIAGTAAGALAPITVIAPTTAALSVPALTTAAGLLAAPAVLGGTTAPATAATQTSVAPEVTTPTPIEVIAPQTPTTADIAAYLGIPAATTPLLTAGATPSTTTSPTTSTTQTVTPTEPEPITVTAPSAATTSLLPTAAIAGTGAITAGTAGTAGAGTAPTTSTTETVTPAEPEPITVTAPTTVPTSLSPAVLAGLATVPPVVAVTGAGTTPSTTTAQDTGQSTSLLDQILKYGSLASLLGGTLGDLFGGGSSGTSGTTTPYTSVLGTAPSLGRGTFQPYTGDYETYGQGPEWNFFGSNAGYVAPTTQAAASPVATTRAVTTPAAAAAAPAAAAAAPIAPAAPAAAAATEPMTTTTPQVSGVLATPENTGMTQERLDQLQSRYENMRSPEFFNYFKAVNDALGTYVNRGYTTSDVAKEYQSRLESAASAPNATLASLQSAVPMPQISDFTKPTGTPTYNFTYTAPATAPTQPSEYINDLYRQIGANLSSGVLNINQARDLQGQLRSAYLTPQVTTAQLQNIYNTGMQQYKPLI